MANILYKAAMGWGAADLSIVMPGHTYTYESNTSTLNAAKMVGYDVLVIAPPANGGFTVNYTDLLAFITNGGVILVDGLYCHNNGADVGAAAIFPWVYNAGGVQVSNSAQTIITDLPASTLLNGISIPSPLSVNTRHTTVSTALPANTTLYAHYSTASTPLITARTVGRGACLMINVIWTFGDPDYMPTVQSWVAPILQRFAVLYPTFALAANGSTVSYISNTSDINTPQEAAVGVYTNNGNVTTDYILPSAAAAMNGSVAVYNTNSSGILRYNGFIYTLVTQRISSGVLTAFVSPVLRTTSNTIHAVNVNSVLGIGNYDYAPPVTTYYMVGKDSEGGMVFWSSVGVPNITPSVTSPPLVGSLQGARVLDKVTK